MATQIMTTIGLANRNGACVTTSFLAKSSNLLLTNLGCVSVTSVSMNWTIGMIMLEEAMPRAEQGRRSLYKCVTRWKYTYWTRNCSPLPIAVTLSDTPVPTKATRGAVSDHSTIGCWTPTTYEQTHKGKTRQANWAKGLLVASNSSCEIWRASPPVSPKTRKSLVPHSMDSSAFKNINTMPQSSKRPKMKSGTPGQSWNVT
mmetsp:Transcript_18842/g.51841  ORF Transcript_18842/g.51841 Transcript_18842/m.51841 type:complete len:201 (+) Transcript_18842:1150-1752(+)